MADQIITQFHPCCQPIYDRLAALAGVTQTLRFLASEELRREVNEGLNVVESWNAANGFIFYGRGGELATNKRGDQEIGLLCLHLVQASLVYINTLMIQEVLEDPVRRCLLIGDNYS